MNLDELVDEVLTRITLSDEQVSQAKEVWLDLKFSVEKGSGNTGRDSAHSYLQMKRLCSEAERIIVEHNSIERKGKSYALDPHLISSYAELTSGSDDRDFDFLDHEWADDSVVTKVEFAEFLYSRLFAEPMFLCTESCREEIAFHYSYLHNYAEKKGALPLDDRLQEAKIIAEKISEIKSRKTMSEFLDIEPSKINEYVEGKFDQLMKTSTARGLTRRYSLQRFSRTMKSLELYMGRSFLSKKMKFDAADDASTNLNSDVLHSVAEIERKLARRNSEIQIAKNKLWSAFKVYWKVRYKSKSLGQGNEFNLKALFELNVFNTILDVLGVDHTVSYITQSNNIYGFLSAFPAGSISCELVHPRNYFYMERPEEFSKYKNQFELFVSRFSAFTNRIKSIDGQITADELSRLNDTFSDSATTLRDVGSFLATEDKHSDSSKLGKYSYVSHSVRNYFQELVSEVEKNGMPTPGFILSASDDLDSLSPKLEELANSSREALKALFQHTQDSIVKSIERITDENEKEIPKAKRNHIIVRSVKKNNEDDPARFTCIPLNGGYRYMFSIHNSKILTSLGTEVSEQPRVFETSAFLKLIEKDCDALIAGDLEIHDRAKTIALKKFVQAFYSASHRDWRLADVIAAQAIDEIEGHTENHIRARLIKQEILFFIHFMKRAAAQQASSTIKKMNLLSEASDLLSMSSEITLGLREGDLLYKTRVNPLSIKQALSSSGLLIEWLSCAYRGGNANRKFRNIHTLKTITPLPPSDNNKIAWASLEVLCTKIPADINTEDISNVVDKLEAAMIDLLDQIAYSSNVDMASVTHNSDFWKYLATRAFSMLQFIQVSRSADFLPGATTIPKGEMDLLWSDYQLNTSNFQKTVNTLTYKKNSDDTFLYLDTPFGNAIQAIRELECVIAERDEATEKMSSYKFVSEVLSNLGDLDDSCYRLHNDGLPRAVLREAKKEFAKLASEEMAILSNSISTTILHPDIWADVYENN